uniref:Uncharacterized protein n=1 Tax=viral metagenome TaxID=1070528 RepID=A0A6C0JM68_9ZZZZ
MKYLVLGILSVIILYILINRGLCEHLTPGPPTLLTLQNDTVDLDSRLTSLKAEFDKMAAQAKQGADASASARAQIGLLKTSPAAPSPP